MLFTNWKENLQPLLEKYKNKKHPLSYQNTYQLLIMVVLSAQDSDANINKVTIPFFTKFPDFNSLSEESTEEIISFISNVENYQNKAKWILEMANTLKFNYKLPTNSKDLMQLKGIGRKSANVILRETHQKAEGIIVDLHVIRVAPRIGLTPKIENGNKIEKILMHELPYEIWNDIGMALSFLGRELCRPTSPKCHLCPMRQHCKYYSSTP